MLAYGICLASGIFKWNFGSVRNAYNSISLSAFVWLQLWCFILEGLLVQKTVQESVSTATHDDLLQISLLCHLHLLVLFCTVSLHAVFLREVLLLTSDEVYVFRLQSIVVLIETFNKSVILFFFLFSTPYAINEAVKNEKGEANEWS